MNATLLPSLLIMLLQCHFADLSLNPLAQVRLVELFGDANGIANRLGRRTAVTDDGHLLAAQQRRTTELRIIQSFLDAAKGLPREECASLRDQSLRPIGFEQSHN